MAEYDKTLFLTGLNGQYKVWKKDGSRASNKVNEIFQMGNLIGCNPIVADKKDFGANEALLKFILLYRATQPEWVQLVGSNEIAALNNPEEWTNQTSRKILRDSWLGSNPNMVVAAVSKNRLVTHGGLTYGEWKNIGSPTSVFEAADRLNEKYLGTLFQGPAFKLGYAPNYSANPIWSDPLMETYPSWITSEEQMPFDQIHGANNLNSERGRLLLGNPENPLYYIDKTRFRKWGSIVEVKNMFFTAVELDFPVELISSVPEGKSFYIEKTLANQ